MVFVRPFIFKSLHLASLYTKGFGNVQFCFLSLLLSFSLYFSLSLSLYLSVFPFFLSFFSLSLTFSFIVYIYTYIYIYIYIYIFIYNIIDINLDVVSVVTQEFRNSFRLLLQTTELLVGTVFPLLLLTCGRCVLSFDVVEKKLFSVHRVSENFSPFI